MPCGSSPASTFTCATGGHLRQLGGVLAVDANECTGSGAAEDDDGAAENDARAAGSTSSETIRRGATRIMSAKTPSSAMRLRIGAGFRMGTGISAELPGWYLVLLNTFGSKPKGLYCIRSTLY